MLGAVRFLWNATRGHRLTPWRSAYLRWRIETYSGKRAETIDAGAFWHFVFEQKWQFLRFLFWVSKMEVQEHAQPKAP